MVNVYRENYVQSKAQRHCTNVGESTLKWAQSNMGGRLSEGNEVMQKLTPHVAEPSDVAARAAS